MRILRASADPEPSPALRVRILRASAQLDQPPRRPSQHARLTGALIGAALALVLLMGQQGWIQQQATQISQQQAALVLQQQQTARNRGVVMAAFGNDDAREAPLTTTDGSSSASGRVLLSPGAGAIAVYAKKLPPLAAGQIYQVWLQGGDAVRAIGTFQPEPNERAWVLLQLEAPLPEPEAIFITIEPAPGNSAPGGSALLRASFP